MSDATPPAEACTSDRAAARVGRQARALQALVGFGLELAEALTEHVTAPAEARTDSPFHGLDPALAFSRIARAIRLTIALEARLDDELLATSMPAAELRPAPAAEAEPADRAEAPEHAEREALRERLDTAYREDREEVALLRLPAPELYLVICRDLGAEPDPTLWADNDAVELEPAAVAAAAGGRDGRGGPPPTAMHGPRLNAPPGQAPPVRSPP